MQRIPIGIRDILLSKIVDTAIVAKFEYRLPGPPGIKTERDSVHFDKRYFFEAIIGADFGEGEINEWVKAHGGTWEAREFLYDKIMERGGSLQPRR
jgi:hypothetical protein